MARKPRFSITGVPQHVIQRGNNREPCFFSEADFGRYLHDLADALEHNDCRLHAYVLMTNHVHLLLTPMTPNGVSRLMQDLGRKYVRYINHSYRRTGTLWEGRYKASLVDSEAFLFTCMRYIELNPVRAGMVAHPGEYRWSSYASNAYGKALTWVTPHPLYRALGKQPTECQEAYRELFNTSIDRDVVHAIREALSHELALGRDDFKDRIEQTLARQTRPKPRGRPRTWGAEEAMADYYLI